MAAGGTFRKGVEEVATKWNGVRQIEGDGDWFFRAFAFDYFSRQEFDSEDPVNFMGISPPDWTDQKIKEFLGRANAVRTSKDNLAPI